MEQPGAFESQTMSAADPPRDPDALIELLLVRFHETHRRELPELERLARRVEATHRAHPDCPAGLAAFLAELGGELTEHMAKEEMILFPMLRAGHGPMAGMAFMTMRIEHAGHCKRLDELAALADGFEAPTGACRTWRALYAGCAKLHDDLREHIRLENDVLFPIFEDAAGAGGCGGG